MLLDTLFCFPYENFRLFFWHMVRSCPLCPSPLRHKSRIGKKRFFSSPYLPPILFFIFLAPRPPAHRPVIPTDRGDILWPFPSSSPLLAASFPSPSLLCSSSSSSTSFFIHAVCRIDVALLVCPFRTPRPHLASACHGDRIRPGTN